MKCMNNFKNPFSLENKKILVTGASSGIGQATAIWISRMGGQVALLARSKEKLEKTLSLLEGSNHRIISLDLLSQENEIEKTIDSLVQEWGPLNGMVYSAGLTITQPLNRLRAEKDYNDIFNVNYRGFLFLSRICCKKKNHTNNTSIVAISSITALKGKKGLTLYASSKAALASSVRCLALEYAAIGIRFNCICPGWVNTPMLKSTREKLGEELFEQNIVSSHPLGLGTPNDIAYAAIYLLSDASRWVTGSSLIIDGGYSC
ncbi:SDR family NAD(P)-dependent oxidoreductase [Aminobacterium mobile]